MNWNWDKFILMLWVSVFIQSITSLLTYDEYSNVRIIISALFIGFELVNVLTYIIKIFNNEVTMKHIMEHKWEQKNEN